MSPLVINHITLQLNPLFKLALLMLLQRFFSSVSVAKMLGWVLGKLLSEIICFDVIRFHQILNIRVSYYEVLGPEIAHPLTI